MSDMIDRIAAIFDPAAFVVATHRVFNVEERQEIARGRAREVLKVMRTPTDEMTYAGMIASPALGEAFEQENGQWVWQAMIDKAIGE